MIDLLFLMILPLAVIAAGLKDLTSLTIPNWLNAGLALAFIPTALIVGMPWADIGISLAVGLATLVVGMILFALRIFGGGDAKLIAAVALWLGASAIAPFVLWTAIAGGSLSLLILIMRSQMQVVAPACPSWVARLLQTRGDIPYGVAIAVGALVAYPSSQLITVFFGR